MNSALVHKLEYIVYMRIIYIQHLPKAMEPLFICTYIHRNSCGSTYSPKYALFYAHIDYFREANIPVSEEQSKNSGVNLQQLISDIMNWSGSEKVFVVFQIHYISHGLYSHCDTHNCLL